MWALGWHQCRYGYNGTADLEMSIQGYKDFNLPLDAQWADIDYMHDYRNFEVNHDKFSNLSNFIDKIHDEGKHFIPIVDSGIAQRKGGNYSAYNSGVGRDVFIKAYKDGPDYTGFAWPNDVVFPDYFREATNQWWGE